MLDKKLDKGVQLLLNADMLIRSGFWEHLQEWYQGDLKSGRELV